MLRSALTLSVPPAPILAAPHHPWLGALISCMFSQVGGLALIALTSCAHKRHVAPGCRWSLLLCVYGSTGGAAAFLASVLINGFSHTVDFQSCSESQRSQDRNS